MASPTDGSSNLKAVRHDRSLRRQELLDAAASLLASRGYGASSMRELADRLNIKAASLYYHFPSKEHLLAEICTIGIQAVNAYLETTLATEESLIGRARAMMRGHVGMLDAVGDYFQVHVTERGHLQEEQLAQLAVHQRQTTALIQQMLQEAKVRGEIAANVDDDTAFSLIIAVLTHVRTARVNRTWDMTEDKAVAMAEIMLSGLAPRD